MTNDDEMKKKNLEQICDNLRKLILEIHQAVYYFARTDYWILTNERLKGL